MRIASACALSLGVLSATASAQCTLSGGLVQFEPNPPGAPRPYSLSVFFSIGTFSSYKPTGQAPRLFVPELFGYQVVELSNPFGPTALGFEDFRFSGTDVGPIPCMGDCHGSIGATAISTDGQRVAFSTSGTASGQLRLAVGAPSGNGWGFSLSGDQQTSTSNALAVQTFGTKYLLYSFADAVRVADVTTLPTAPMPGFPAPGSIVPDLTTLPTGYGPVLVGTWLVYTSGSAIFVVDVSSPVPPSALTVATTLTAADFGRPSEHLTSFDAALDPSDPSALYVLGELAAGTNTFRGVVLLRLRGGVKTVLGAMQPAVDDTATHAIALGSDGAGHVFGLMWARTAAGAYRLTTSPAGAFGSASSFIDVTDPTFRAGRPAVLAGAGSGQLYVYTPAATNGWVVPLSCVAPDAGAPSADAGAPDAGFADAGASMSTDDAGTLSPGADAGGGSVPDAGADGGTSSTQLKGGCGCAAGLQDLAAPWVAFAMVMLARRARAQG